MSKFATPLLTLALGAAGATMFASVTLQPATPGTKETGNINVSGSVISGKVLAGLNSSNSVITGFSSANGTTAVQGTAKSIGVRGLGTGTSGAAYGGYFESNGPEGAAVYAKKKTSGLGNAIYAESPSGTVAKFVSTDTFAPSTGLRVENQSPHVGALGIEGRTLSGTALQGVGTDSGSTGVYGSAASVGVSGNSGLGWGVSGTTNSSTAYGVYGYAPTGSTGHAIFANGTFGALGTKSLVIDHPHDPENRYLLQFCTEGDTPQLQYRGTVKLDSSGAATVQLPEYFADINRDPSYQLTPVGAAMPNLHVADEVKNNRFRIAGGKANAKVSWTVIGIRNDRFVQKFGAETEPMKPADKRGTYLQPELYNKKPEMGQNYRLHPTESLGQTVPPKK